MAASEREGYPFHLIPAPLIGWYRANRRALPWRENPTPYRVWVSEIMLQQTRVEAARDYYLRFLRELPDVRALAECPEEKLLKLWEGLGYYSRARNLQRAAKIVCERYGGVFPAEERALRELPGIGEYTAGAILSIAFGKRAPAVDGNVLRVASRLTEDPSPVSDPRYKAHLSRELAAVYPPEGRDCSDFTQALMELGALVCKPSSPDCAACPVRALCRAAEHGTQASFPVLPEKKEKRREGYLRLSHSHAAGNRRPQTGSGGVEGHVGISLPRPFGRGRKGRGRYPEEVGHACVQSGTQPKIYAHFYAYPLGYDLFPRRGGFGAFLRLFRGGAGERGLSAYRF